MDGVTCILCNGAILAREDVVIRTEGVAHVACPARKPLARVIPELREDFVCAQCAEPIGPLESVAQDGGDLLHVRCLTLHRPRITGGCAALVWGPIRDARDSVFYALTPAGHRDFMNQCAETRLVSRDTAMRARVAVAETRATVRSGAARRLTAA